MLVLERLTFNKQNTPPGSPRTLTYFETTSFLLHSHFFTLTEIVAQCPKDSNVLNIQSLLLSAVTHFFPFLTTLIFGISLIRHRSRRISSTVSPIERPVCLDAPLKQFAIEVWLKYISEGASRNSGILISIISTVYLYRQLNSMISGYFYLAQVSRN